jgi:hypothetical protein
MVVLPGSSDTLRQCEVLDRLCVCPTFSLFTYPVVNLLIFGRHGNLVAVREIRRDVDRFIVKDKSVEPVVQ